MFSVIRKSNRGNAERNLFREIATFFTDYPDFQNMLVQSIRNYYFPNQSALYCAHLWFPSNETKSLQAIQEWINLNSPITKEKFQIVFRFYSDFPSPPHHLLLSFLHLQLAIKTAEEKPFTFHLQTAQDFYHKAKIDYIYQKCGLLYYKLAEQVNAEADYLYLVKGSLNPIKAIPLIKKLHNYLGKEDITLYTFPGAVQFSKRELDLLEERYQKLLHPNNRYIILSKSFLSLLGYSQ